eukprot:CAMPEP_0195309640 /NCGR_PEP_ID=MMETSP0707-20130614/38839_1 /TAXON_ID=33640 /ORGANISM="Asterionellopsis glacialis, Strain CCMP134" /LENGTH=388 /DNA_ID=CAMNT_0040373937 /DNA_START=108 /DNA_END=1274 /DNA_ORIENTATION=+
MAAIKRASSRQELTEILAAEFDQRGISGVLNWCQGVDLTRSYTPEDLVEAAVRVDDKGKASGILNALLGSCCYSSSNCNKEEEFDAQFAFELFQAYNASTRLKPDIVTLSLTYSATCKVYPTIAKALLPCSSEQIETKTDPKAHAVSFDLLYKDENFIILNKPSGLVLSQNPNEARTARSKKFKDRSSIRSLEQILLEGNLVEKLSSLNPDGSRGFVHRLDRGTSGCLVIAKSNEWHARLISQFFLRRVQKSYIALVYTNNLKGGTELPNEGTISLPIGGRPAQSSFALLKRVGNLAAILLVTTKQGRKHQVRIHCSKGLKTPILLDPLYGGEAIMFHLNSSALSAAKKLRSEDKFCLHANTLSMPAFDVHVKAPLPDWWDEILDGIA